MMKPSPSSRFLEDEKKMLFLAGTNFAKISKLVIVKTTGASHIKSKKINAGLLTRLPKMTTWVWSGLAMPKLHLFSLRNES